MFFDFFVRRAATVGIDAVLIIPLGIRDKFSRIIGALQQLFRHTAGLFEARSAFCA
jgi:hypothetical protein